MSGKKDLLIPPYMNFEYTKCFIKDNGNGRRFHRCTGATFGKLRVYDIRQAEVPITRPYRHNGDVIDSVLFKQAYPGPYFDFQGCWFSDVLAIDDFAIQYDPDKNVTFIHEKPKIREKLDCSLKRTVQELSSFLMYFMPIMRLNSVKPKNIMKRGKVDKDTPDYPVFQLIQELNFDPNPKMTANRFLTQFKLRDECDTSLLFKVSANCYKCVSIQFSGMHVHVDRFDRDDNAEPGNRITRTYEDARDGMQGLEILLQQIKQGRDQYVQEQYYVRK